MSQQTFAEQIQALAEADHAMREQYNNRPAESRPVLLRLDPVELLNQVQSMRAAGVNEAVIRAAFEQAIEQVQGKPRRGNASMTTHKDVPKMPEQAEINRIYVERYAHGIDDQNIQNDSVSAIVDAIKRSRDVAVPPKPKLRVRVATYLVRKVLQACIFICKAMGVK